MFDEERVAAYLAAMSACVFEGDEIVVVLLALVHEPEYKHEWYDNGMIRDR